MGTGEPRRTGTARRPQLLGKAREVDKRLPIRSHIATSIESMRAMVGEDGARTQLDRCLQSVRVGRNGRQVNQSRTQLTSYY